MQPPPAHLHGRQGGLEAGQGAGAAAQGLGEGLGGHTRGLATGLGGALSAEHRLGGRHVIHKLGGVVERETYCALPGLQRVAEVRRENGEAQHAGVAGGPIQPTNTRSHAPALLAGSAVSGHLDHVMHVLP